MADVNLEIQATQLRDGLETLVGVARLPASAVKDLPDAVTTQEITVNVDVPNLGYKRGDVIAIGTTLTAALKQLLTSTFFPTFVNPTFSLSRSGAALRIIGDSTSFNLTFNFSRGTILGAIVAAQWDANAIQAPRAGASTGFVIDGVSQAGNVLARTETVIQGLNTFLATVSYAIGAQPTDSVGDNFDNPFASGTSSNQSTNFEGVFALFASTSSIAVATQQTLVSMLNANNVVINLVAESGGNKQFIDIPTAWLNNRALTAIQFFNSVSGQFDTTNQLSTFTTSAVTKTVASNTVNYTRYTNNTSDRGAIQIRLIF